MKRKTKLGEKKEISKGGDKGSHPPCRKGGDGEQLAGVGEETEERKKEQGCEKGGGGGERLAWGRGRGRGRAEDLEKSSRETKEGRVKKKGFVSA